MRIDPDAIQSSRPADRDIQLLADEVRRLRSVIASGDQEEEIASLRQQRDHWIATAMAFDEHLATLRVMLMEMPGVRFGAAASRETVQLTDAELEALGWAARMIDDINRGDPARAAILRSMLSRAAKRTG